MTRIGRNAAFTLFEVLVTLSLVAIVLGITYGSYAASVKSVSVCRARAVLDGDGRALLREMAREIRCAWMPAQPDRKLETAAFVGDGSGLTFATAAAGWGLDEPSAGISVIGYRCDRGTLFRSQRGLPDADQPSVWQPVVSGLRKVELEFFDGKAWQRYWDSDDTGSLPAAVRVEITMTGGAESMTLATTAWIAGAGRGTVTPAPSLGTEVGTDDAQLAHQ